MSHHKFHWFEKTQVQLATVAAMAAVYFLLWPMLRPWDPQGPAMYVHYGSWAKLGLLAIVLLSFAALAGAITIKSRPEGAIIVALFGLGGVSLRSGQFRQAIFTQPDGIGPMFSQMLGELFVMAAMLVAVVGVVYLIRALAAKISPALIWHDVLADKAYLAEAAPSKSDEKAKARKTINIVGCLLLSLAIAVPLLMLLLQSTDRGQVIFALLASCGLAVLIAHQLLPSQYSFVAWTMPIIMGIGVYVLAIVQAVPGSANSWTATAFIVQILPVDWLTAGAGGGVLGYWISERIHEMKYLEQKEKG
ncbi:MAG: hypothetical protein EHM48_08440 [Planctomycetaceae bacterium]|nr:MAG: hypothetical protein EHM48_08440 [Planctomycetaceae bacterium]